MEINKKPSLIITKSSQLTNKHSDSQKDSLSTWTSLQTDSTPLNQLSQAYLRNIVQSKDILLVAKSMIISFRSKLQVSQATNIIMQEIKDIDTDYVNNILIYKIDSITE